MRWLLSFALLLAALASTPAQAQIRKFGDWAAACDNQADGKVAAAKQPRFVLPAAAAAFIPRAELTGRKDSIHNPEWDGERMVLAAFYARRSAGNCGEQTEWTWTGREFRLTELRRMTECEGIPGSDFPVLYSATRRE